MKDSFSVGYDHQLCVLLDCHLLLYPVHSLGITARVYCFTPITERSYCFVFFILIRDSVGILLFCILHTN